MQGFRCLTRLAEQARHLVLLLVPAFVLAALPVWHSSALASDRHVAADTFDDQAVLDKRRTLEVRLLQKEQVGRAPTHSRSGADGDQVADIAFAAIVLVGVTRVRLSRLDAIRPDRRIFHFRPAQTGPPST